MATSYNGWPASPDLATRPLVVAGESFIPGVLDDDDVWTVLNYVATQMHERVEPIVRADWHQADDWGYNYRATTGGTSLSNHASGTAIDYNATRHPYGVPAYRNFTSAQIAEIHRILGEVGVVAWGGDYSGTPDAMHFDIKGTREQVAAAAARIRAGEDEDMRDEDWARMRSIIREEVRPVVREELRNEGFLDKIGDEVWQREWSATNASGVRVKKSAREFLVGAWEAIKAHAKTPDA